MDVVMDIEGIQRILPHRYPFLLVDRITECDNEKRIVGYKNVTINEPFFNGHFPGMPVMPGVLELEAMAQLAGVLINQVQKKEGAIAYLLGVDQARFRKVVKPGDQLVMEIDILKYKLSLVRVQGTARVGDEITCEAQLMFGYGS
jgi:beta-hydroxyacyl-ACP dehydratase FabZ